MPSSYCNALIPLVALWAISPVALQAETHPCDEGACFVRSYSTSFGGSGLPVEDSGPDAGDSGGDDDPYDGGEEAGGVDEGGEVDDSGDDMSPPGAPFNIAYDWAASVMTGTIEFDSDSADVHVGFRVGEPFASSNTLNSSFSIDMSSYTPTNGDSLRVYGTNDAGRGSVTLYTVELDVGNCLDPTQVGEVGTGYECHGMLIVDRSMLSNAITNGSFAITHSPTGQQYTLADSSYNVYTGQIQDMNSLFRRVSFNGDIGYWDTSRVTRMDYMFAEATTFNQSLDWDTSSVNTMDYMFNGATSFNQPLNWDTSNVTNMAYMFRDASSFDQSLAWDVASVQQMNFMFSDAASMNGDLSCWDVSHLARPTAFDRNTGNWDNVHKPRFGQQPDASCQ